MRAVAAPGSHGRSTPPTRQSHQWDASQSRPRRALQEWTCAVKNTGTMPAGSAAFLAFFAIIYMNIAAITFMALALLARGLSPAQTGLVLGWKVAQPNPELILPLHAVFALAATAVATLLPQSARPVAPPGLRLRLLAAAPGLGPLVAAAALTGMGMGVNNTFLAVFLRDLGGPGWTLGAAFAIAAMGEVPLMAKMQHLIHRFGVSRLVGVGLLVLPVRWGLYALLHSPWPILPLQLLHSVAIACLEVAGVLLVRDLTRPEWSATAQAFYGAALMGLGPSPGTVMAGAIYEWRGLHTVFGVSVIPALAAWLLFAGLHPRRSAR